MKDFFKKYWIAIFPPIILYIIFVFEKTKRTGKEIIFAVLINFVLWLFFSSIFFNPEIYGF